MLKEDLELSREDIQDLSSRDALAAFFAKLGYDTNDRLVQNVAAMGFASDNLKSAITHIERLASQDGRMFEVYLFELKSVTIANTQGIVRTFRNRPGDYLLYSPTITSDWTSSWWNAIPLNYPGPNRKKRPALLRQFKGK